MNNDQVKRPGALSTNNKEAELLKALWEADAFDLTPAPITSKAKQAIQDMLRAHGITNMPAIDSIPVYDESNGELPTSTPLHGCISLADLLAAVRSGVALAAQSVQEFVAAMTSPLTVYASGAMRRKEGLQDELSSMKSDEFLPALSWHIESITATASGDLRLWIATHKPTQTPIHVAVLGWRSQSVADLQSVGTSKGIWQPAPEDVTCLWQGDLEGGKNRHRISFSIPEGLRFHPEFDGVGTALVDDEKGSLIANLMIDGK